MKLALKAGMEWGMRKWPRAFQGEGTVRAKGRKCCRRTDCAGIKGLGISERRNEVKRLRLRRFFIYGLDPTHSRGIPSL